MALPTVFALPADCEVDRSFSLPRAGFDPRFLDEHLVALPTLTPEASARAVTRDHSEVIPYTHFSLAINGERRFAFWVAWNIDGGRLGRIDRTGFREDGRLKKKHQADARYYGPKRLEKGHLARRDDLVWGDAVEACQANYDSAYWPNIAPQMDDFNRNIERKGHWHRLETALIEHLDAHDRKVSVVAGCVFRDDDPPLLDIQVPLTFWKVVIFVEDGTLKADGFVLTQVLDIRESLDVPFPWGEFATYRRTLAEIEALCDVRLDPTLKAGDSWAEQLRTSPMLEQVDAPLESTDTITW